MIDLERFVADVLDCLGWPYVSPGGTGKDCSRCGIDCSGLLVRAYKLQGESLYHGSNYIARYELDGDPEKLRSEGQLVKGMAVFKWSSSGEPERYRKDGKGNFHHIGVVTQVNPLRITHASSVAGKVKQDSVVGKWTHCGRLKRVDYKQNSEGSNMQKFKVTAASGETVNLRRSASTTADVIVKVPIGTVVSAEPCQEGWHRVEYICVTGYMMSKFLTEVKDEPVKDELSALKSEISELQENIAELKEEIALLKDRVSGLEGGVG